MGMDARIYIVPKEEPTEEMVEHLNNRILDCFGRWELHLKDDDVLFTLEERSSYEDESIPPKYIQIPCLANGRYYGVGYERGPLLLYAAVMEWVRLNDIGKVYYGSDSYDELPDEWTEERAQKLLAHFFKHGHQPYRSPRK